MKKIYSMILTLSFTSVLIATSVNALSDSVIVGNGGDAVVCRNPENNEIVSAEVLDVYEARTIRGQVLDLDPKLSVNALVQYITNRLQEKEKVSAQIISDFANTFIEEAIFIENVKLEDIKDSHHIITPEGCEVEQVVIQNQPDKFNPKRYTVNDEIWQSFDNANKAAMIIHEAVYRLYLKERTANDSRVVRLITSQLVSESFSEQFWEIIDNFKSIGLRRFELYVMPGIRLFGFERSEENEFLSFRGRVNTENYSASFFEYNITLKKNDHLSFDSSTNIYTIHFHENNENIQTINIGGGNIINKNQQKLRKISYERKIPKNTDGDDKILAMETRITVYPTTEEDSSGNEVSDVEVFLDGLSIYSSALTFSIVQDIQTKNVQRINNIKIKSNHLSCNALIDSLEGYLCIDLDNGATVYSLNPLLKKSESYRIIKSQFFEKATYHASEVVNYIASKPVDRDSKLNSLNSQQSAIDFAQLETGDYSITPYTEAFDELLDPNIERPKYIRAGGSIHLSEEEAALLPEKYIERWSSGGYFFSIPYLSTRNFLHHENGVPMFNAGDYGNGVQGFINHGNSQEEVTLKVFNILKFSNGRNLYNFNEADIHGFNTVAVPYPERFSNNQIKYVVVTDSLPLLTEVYVYSSNNTTIKIEKNTLLIFDEDGSISDAFRIDTFYGAIRANEIRTAQVKKFGSL